MILLLLLLLLLLHRGAEPACPAAAPAGRKLYYIVCYTTLYRIIPYSIIGIVYYDT